MLKTLRISVCVMDSEHFSGNWSDLKILVKKCQKTAELHEKRTLSTREKQTNVKTDVTAATLRKPGPTAT